MALSTGARLGSYDVLGALGAGGMGEVYRARDTKLGRDVAIKVLPELFAADSERLARFQREAQLLAALNHPNIAAIYGLEDAASTGSGQAGATRFIVMELVEGQSLAQRLTTPIARDEVLRIARQIVDAFEAAHEKGIVHRDLKPANVMLTDDGQVKVLDFGLAKLEAGGAGEAGSAGAAGALTHSPTLTFAATQAGMILGTAAYMSPEQARGRTADKRSDVWAFGCVLYEMLAGKRAFEGEDATDIIAAVVRAEPDWSALPANLAPAIRTLIERCLVKDRKARIPDMSVVRFLLADAEEAPPTAAAGTAAAQAPAGRVAVVASLAAIGGAAITALAMWAIARPVSAPGGRPVRFTMTTPPTQAIGLGGPDRVVTISPDGARIVFISGGSLGGGGQLMMRAINQIDAVPVRGLANVRAPFISPDSRWIGFFDTGKLQKVPVSGGSPVLICNVAGGTRGSSWSTDGTIVFATNDATAGLLSVPAAGGEPKILTRPDTANGETDHFFPSMLPDARAVLFTIVRQGSIDNAEIAVLDLRTGQRKTLIRGGTHGEYVSIPTRSGWPPRLGSGEAGYILYASGGELRAIRFDAARLETEGDPVVVVDQIRTEVTGAAQFSVSRDGSLVYGVGGASGFENRSLVWVNRRGQEQAMGVPPRQYVYPRISPDGTRVLLTVTGQEQDIWMIDLRHLTPSRLTFSPALEQNAIWMPDGKQILFSSTQSGIPNVFSQLADNTGSMQQLTKSQTLVTPYSVSPDGQLLAVSTTGGTDIGLVHLDRPTETTPLIDGPGSQINAEISPDGRWIAYQSAETGQYHIYVRPFPNVNDGRWQITTDQGGGSRPLWARSGRELFYIAGVDADRAMMAVSVQTTPTFQYGNPTRLFAAPYSMALPGRTFDVSPDGQKFLMVRQEASRDTSAATPIAIIVTNWFDELKARLPPNR